MMVPGASRDPLTELRLWRQLNSANELDALMVRHPGLSWRTIWTVAVDGRQTAIMHYHGRAKDLDALSTQYIHSPPAQTEIIHSLQRGRQDMIVYEVERSGVNPTDITGVLQSTLGPNTLFEVSKSSNGVFWRVFTTANRARLLSFLDGVSRRGRPFIRAPSPEAGWFEVQRLRHHGVSLLDAERAGLSPEESLALATAKGFGFYEQPKRVSIKDLAARLHLPPSTLHGQIGRAERKAISWALEHMT